MNGNKEVVNYWLKASEQDFDTAKILFDNKKYHHSLFFCHLSVEKMLKSIIVKVSNQAPPLVHDLVRLAERAKLKIAPQLVNELAEISAFNIEARYDDYKLSFYKKADKPFAEKYLKKTKDILQWLKESI
jgi:HEPN domain-containing protein